MANVEQQIAQDLLEIGAVGFKPKEPITFKSKLISPVYVDNRRFPFHPKAWRHVIEGFANLINTQELDFDVVAGIETAGIPHSAALGFWMAKPSVFIRKEVKDHGTKKRVEGGDVAGKKVLLIEDHITTGGSSLSGVEALREEGAEVVACLAITSYEFAEADKAFADASVALYTLTSFQVILQEADKLGRFQGQEKALIEDWLQDPQNWAKKHGFTQ